MQKLNQIQIGILLEVKIKKQTIDRIRWYIEDSSSPTDFWGFEKPRGFLYDVLLLTLYKDLYNKSFDFMISNTSFGYHITKKSLETNIHRMRRAMSNWADENIVVGDINDWKAAVRNNSFGKSVEHANLWMDSSDFTVENRGDYTPSSPEWSYKENKPARRFMVVSDGKGKIRRVWGGYSPKLYDGDFLEGYKESMEFLFNGGVILADNHFSKGRHLFKNIKFLCNFAIRSPPSENRRKRKRGERDEDFVDNMTRAQEAFNKQHQKARARVESPFGWIKTKFEALSYPWKEDWVQLNYLVKTAFAIYNVNNM